MRAFYFSIDLNFPLWRDTWKEAGRRDLKKREVFSGVKCKRSVIRGSFLVLVSLMGLASRN